MSNISDFFDPRSVWPMDNLPHAFAAMAEYRQFIVYRAEPGAGGKWQKAPCDWRTGNVANAHDPAIWTSAVEVLAAAKRLGPAYGIAFVFTDADPFVFLDIDDKPDSPIARELRELLPDAACEISLSGNLHLFGRWPAPLPHSCDNKAHAISLYHTRRFVALTGVAACGDAGADLSSRMPALVARYFAPGVEVAGSGWTTGPCPEWRGPADDDELIRRALAARPSAHATFGQAATFGELWTADPVALRRCFPAAEPRADGLPYDASRADAAVATHLAYWTGRDCERIERLMRRSGLAREKWEQRGYLARTITGAVGRCGQVLGEAHGVATPALPGAPPSEPAPGAGLALVQGSTIEPEPIRWLWPGWLARGKLHVIAGQPGTGKTSIALALAAMVTAGGRWPDGLPAGSGNVLVWSGEDDPRDTLVPRLLASGADLSRCFFVGDIHGAEGRRSFDPAQDMPDLARAAEQVGDIRMLLIDPIVSAVAGDSHKNAEVRRGLAPLVELAARLDCALLGISHFTKGTAGRDPLERVTGSLAFGALARIVFAAFKQSEDDGGGRCFCRVKSNIGPDNGGFAYGLQQRELTAHPGVMASFVAWGGAVHATARELLGRAEADTQPGDVGEQVEAVDFLKGVLADGPVPASEVKQAAREQGITAATLRRAKARLRVVSTRSGFGRGSIVAWTLPVISESPGN